MALTRLEFLTLVQLMEHPGQSVGKAKLLASVWGYDFGPGSNVVDVCVRRLRSKLGFDLIKRYVVRDTGSPPKCGCPDALMTVLAGGWPAKCGEGHECGARPIEPHVWA